jgi:hypothetical protein
MRSPTSQQQTKPQNRKPTTTATLTRQLTSRLKTTQHSHGDSITLPQTISSLTPDHTSPPTFAHIPPRLANHTVRSSVRQHFRPSGSTRTSIRRAERQYGRPRSQLHAPAAVEREPQPLQRMLWRLPLRIEHERLLRRFPRGTWNTRCCARIIKTRRKLTSDFTGPNTTILRPRPHHVLLLP